MVRWENETLPASILMEHPTRGKEGMVIESLVTGLNGEAIGMWERIQK